MAVGRSELAAALARLAAEVVEGLDLDEALARIRGLADCGASEGFRLSAPSSNVSASERRRDASKKIAIRLFEYWRTAMDRPRAKLTQDRLAVIRARLREGYSEEEIKRAIDGCTASPFHMGANESGRQYNDIKLICRNGEKLESFAELAGGMATQSESDLSDLVRASREALRDGDHERYEAIQQKLRALNGKR